MPTRDADDTAPPAAAASAASAASSSTAASPAPAPQPVLTLSPAKQFLQYAKHAALSLQQAPANILEARFGAPAKSPFPLPPPEPSREPSPSTNNTKDPRDPTSSPPDTNHPKNVETAPTVETAPAASESGQEQILQSDDIPQSQPSDFPSPDLQAGGETGLPSPAVDECVVAPPGPPVPPSLPGMWTCPTCSIVVQKQRCPTCRKWRGGKRGGYKKKNPSDKKMGKVAKAKAKKKAKAKAKAKAPSEHPRLPSLPTIPSLSPPMAAVESDRNEVDPSPLTVGTGAGTATVATAATAESNVLETNNDIRERGAADDIEEGNGGDSDGEGEGGFIADEHNSAMLDVFRERDDPEGHGIETDACLGFDDYHEGTADDHDPAANLCTIPGAPPGWTPPTPPQDWTPTTKAGTPPYASCDNPGRWKEYCFRPKHARGGDYRGRFMPAGARPVPLNPETGKRTEGEWEFFYQGWDISKSLSPDERSEYETSNMMKAKLSRLHADSDNLFPDERRGCLDAELLKKMGLTKERMEEGDALFFYQLLLPMCNPKYSGIKDDPRQSFYLDVSNQSNRYAIVDRQLDGNYGHQWKTSTAYEFVNFDGIVFRNTADSIHDSWCTDSEDFDPVIAKTMRHHRFLELKRHMKLNNNATEKKRGEEGYDPCAKYRLIWDVMVHNMNSCVEKASLDLTVDETTWASMSFGSEALFRVRGKPGVAKGGQNVVLLDSKRRYIHAWYPRHSVHKKEAPFTQQGPSEIKAIVDRILPLIEGRPQEKGDKRRQIFSVEPHLSFDNHFSGNPVMHHLGVNKFKATCTSRRDRLPDNCSKESFHYDKLSGSNPHDARVARFEQPIVAVKRFTPSDRSDHEYIRVHVSFQSTGGTNISTVNALDRVHLFVRQKTRGRGDQKRVYGIEMNEGRALYLGTYSSVDSVDHLLKNWSCSYVNWKWYHSPIRHAKALAATMAFFMYQECAEGNLDEDWKIENPMKMKRFRKKLGRQMCEYRPWHLRYPGDEYLRGTTKRSKARRGRKRKAPSQEARVKGRVTYEQYAEERRNYSRFCNEDLEHLKSHLHCMVRKSYHGNCEVCGKGGAYWLCTLCDKLMHLKSSGRNGHIGELSCAVDYHNESFFGLAKCDAPKVGLTDREWCVPTEHDRDSNHWHIHGLRRRFLEEQWKEEDCAEGETF